MVQRWHHCGDVVFQIGGLVYDIVPEPSLSLYILCDYDYDICNSL